jgi:hypothetical protein
MKSARGALILATILIAVGCVFPVVAGAQAPTDTTVTHAPDTTAVIQSAPPPAATTTVQVSTPPPTTSVATEDAGMFSKGKRRVSGVVGYARSFDSDYLLVGVGVGYFIRNGLDVGVDFEGWFLGDPTIYKLSPRVDWVAWRMQRIKPYAGAFYRWNFIGGGLEDHSSIGGRAGAFYKGAAGGMAGAGVVYERYLGIDDRFSSDVFYPEVFIAKSF